MPTFTKRKILNAAKRLLFVCVFGVYVKAALCLANVWYNEDGLTLQDMIRSYGLGLTCVLYSMTIAAYVSVPIAVCQILGLLMYNPFGTSRSADSKTSLLDTPFICFRVVTRGSYPKLVCDNTERNLETCRKVGIQNFKFWIVTDKAINVHSSNYVREVVVPASYKTPNGTLFKARALHYCLGPNINILSPDDWIVHLDEESVLTEELIHGLLKFVTTPGSNIGQGVITYGGCGIEHWLTTLLDGARVAVDYGLFRFGLQYLHRPIFGFKGSFVVAKHSIEEKIGFDFGPYESIAEDLRFALTAWHNGYKFDFVEGVMKEKSAFSIADFVKQRKRWLIGHFHVIWGNSLPLYCKMAVMPLNVLNILLWINILNTILSFIFPVAVLKWQSIMFASLLVNICLMLAFGNFMSLCYRRYSLIMRLLIAFVSQGVWPLLAVLEGYAALKGFVQRNQLSFEIVQKEVKATAGYSISDSDHVV